MGFDYDKAAEEKASTGRKPYLEPDVDFKRLLITKAEFSHGYTGSKYLIEGRVLEAVAAEEGATVPPVGAERFHSIDLENKDYGMANLMAFVEGLNGGPLTERDDGKGGKITKGQQMRFLLGEAAVSEDDAKKAGVAARGKREAFAIGMLIGNRTNNGPDVDKEGKPKKPFTYMNWYAIKQDKPDIVARKKALKDGLEIKPDGTVAAITTEPAPA